MYLHTIVQLVISCANYEHNIRYSLESKVKGKKNFLQAIKYMHHDNAPVDNSTQFSYLVKKKIY